MNQKLVAFLELSDKLPNYTSEAQQNKKVWPPFAGAHTSVATGLNNRSGLVKKLFFKLLGCYWSERQLVVDAVDLDLAFLRDLTLN